MRSKTRLAALGAGLAVALTGLHPCTAGAAGSTQSGSTQSGSAERGWARAATAKIHPGVPVEIGGVTCTAGFILTDGKRVFLTLTAGCAGASPGENVNGCPTVRESAGVDPPNTEAKITGARHKGHLVYNSFERMKRLGEKRTNRCHYNQLALIKIDRRDVKRVNPSVPTVGGPGRVAQGDPEAPDRLSVFLTAPTTAEALQTSAGGWAHDIMVDGHLDVPNAGAPVLTGSGAALGMVTVVPSHGTVGPTTVSNLGLELRALHHAHGFEHVRLATGTADYTGP
jgi:hypothetical protein